ncbi:S9 family peptidase [Mycolicibacterium sp. CH28]|uniref:alpha/beta hydrolase family protein n=1 Tax=Mycolicibacterium sp. CH28 TaxID=2512237 RepID=UPI001386C980|nr:CocE/NonD family hydrolase [Mycolicibacterium sp. CH28]
MLTTALHDVLDPFSGGLPTVPVDSPLALALAAFTRRESGAAAVTSTPSALTTASLLVGNNPIVVNPSLGIIDGIFNGSTGASTTSGDPLTYTLVSNPSAGGKVTFAVPGDTGYAAGNFTYLPDKSILTSGSEQFKILVAETTQFDKLLEGIPIVGGFVPQVLVVLHQTPILGDLLAPVIGYSQLVTFTPDPSVSNPLGAPVAFTYKMPSFDGTLISVNWFPASTLGPDGVSAGTKAPTILNGPGLASPGQTDPYATYGIKELTPGVQPLRDAGYNVVTWDPRGEFASGGVLQLDSPAYEGRDVSAMLNWVATQPTSQLDGANDPRVGMVGGSYGGGIQLTSAGTDSRIDAIVPGIAWNSLNGSLYPDNAFKTSYASLLLLSLVTTGARINNQIYLGVLTGDLVGWLSNTAKAVLASSGPNFVVGNIQAPTLFIQGTVDVLFTLQQAIDNAQTMAAGVPTQMIWFCGGHGVCLTNDTTGTKNLDASLNWLNKYVKGEAVALGPKFQYADQYGNWYQANDLPTAGSPFFGSSFNAASGASGGFLGIVPVLGGSGPAPQASIPYSLGLASKANNAINVEVDTTGLTQTVGSPTLSFDYQGLGTTRYVYAQLVDNKTGLVVGNLVTPVPVTLDGQTHSVTVNMENIVYTVQNPATDNLTLQITSSATAYENFTSYGVVNISNIGLSLPTPASVTPEP